MVERQPGQGDHRGVQHEAEHAGGGRGGEERRVFRLAGVNHGLETETPAIAGGGARIHVGDHCSDGCEGGGDAQAGEKIGQRGRDTQEEELLPRACPVQVEKLDEMAVGRDEALSRVHDQGKKRDDEGEKQLRRGLSLLPNAADLHHALGLLLVRKTNNTEALNELAEAAKLAPDNARYAYVYGIGLNSAGKQREALAALKAADAHHPYNLDILRALISIQREAGDNKSALVYARKAADALPDDAGVKRLVEELEAAK